MLAAGRSLIFCKRASDICKKDCKRTDKVLKATQDENMCQVDLLCSALSVGGVLSSEKDDSQSRAAADGNKKIQERKFSK